MQKLTTAPIDGAKYDQKLRIVIIAWEYLSCITLVGTFECNIWWSFVSHARSLSLPVSMVLRLPRIFCYSLDVTMCWTRKFSNPAISRKYIFMCIKHYWLLWVLQSSHESLAVFLFLSFASECQPHHTCWWVSSKWMEFCVEGGNIRPALLITTFLPSRQSIIPLCQFLSEFCCILDAHVMAKYSSMIWKGVPPIEWK